MLQAWVVIAFALGYIGLLFIVATYGDETGRLGRERRWRRFIYPLSLAIIGTIPYIALQLKAVSSSLTTILVRTGPASATMQPVLGDIAFYVALAMAMFAVLFGTRHIDATEHQDGLMLAIATESLVKLI